MTPTLEFVGNWGKDIEVPLKTALETSMEVFGYTAEKSARQCVAFMAQSASKLTRIAPKKRPVEANPDFKHLLKKEQYKTLAMRGGMTARQIGQWYKKWRAVKLRQGRTAVESQVFLYANAKDTISKIGNRGIAKKSWMWGFGRGRPIPGVTKLYTISGGRASTSGEMSADMTVGYMLTNKLDYIMAALPNGWEQTVERLATNRVMGQARAELHKLWPGEFMNAAERAARATRK
jgi:hypothetical protein